MLNLREGGEALLDRLDLGERGYEGAWVYGDLTGLDFELEDGLGVVVHLSVVDVAAEVKEREGLGDNGPLVLDFPGARPRSDVFDYLDRPVPMAPTLIVGPAVLDVGCKELGEGEVVVLEEEETIEGAYSASEVLEGASSDSGVGALLTVGEGEGLEEVCTLF